MNRFIAPACALIALGLGCAKADEATGMAPAKPAQTTATATAETWEEEESGEKNYRGAPAGAAAADDGTGSYHYDGPINGLMAKEAPPPPEAPEPSPAMDPAAMPVVAAKPASKPKPRPKTPTAARVKAEEKQKLNEELKRNQAEAEVAKKTELRHVAGKLDTLFDGEIDDDEADEPWGGEGEDALEDRVVADQKPKERGKKTSKKKKGRRDRLGDELGDYTLQLGSEAGYVDVDKDGGRGPVVRKPAPVRPASFLPRQAYFENRYLGGNAAHEAQLRKLDRDLGAHTRPYAQVHAPAQPFDPPTSDAIALTATLDRRWLGEGGPVYLQIGLQGSHRYGWRRPPLDVALVVDDALRQAHGDEPVLALVDALRLKLEPQDRVGVILAGSTPAVLAEVEPGKRLPRRLDADLARRPCHVPAPADLEAALDAAGQLLQRAAQDQARVAGSQVVLLATSAQRAGVAAQAETAARAAHRLTVQGAVTSVIEVGGQSEGHWWPVAASGHGNYHRASGTSEEALRGTVDAELELLSKVVARLLRVNIRLGKHAHAMRILGSRLLGQEEVVAVKAREVATDRNLAKTLGVKADRGDDDDGLQTVIPYYYGGDSHVILVELWVDEPGAVAEISLKYKDMVRLGNATASTSVSLARTPRDATPDQRLVRRNVGEFAVADVLLEAARDVRASSPDRAARRIRTALGRTAHDAALTDLLALVESRPSGSQRQLVAEALEVAALRKVGVPAPR